MADNIRDTPISDVKVQNGSVPTGEDEQGKMVPAEKNTESLEKMHEDTEPQKGGKELDVEIKNEPNLKIEKENSTADEQTEDDKLKVVPITENKVETEEGISKETGEKEEEKRTDLLDSAEEKVPAENRDTEQKEEKGEAQKEAVIDTTTETLPHATVKVSDEGKELIKRGIDNVKEIGAVAETPISDGDKIPELEDKPVESQAKQVHEIISSEETLSESQDKVVEVDTKLAESENEGISDINSTEETKIKDSGKDIVDQKVLQNKPEDVPDNLVDKLTGMDQNSGEHRPENMQENNIQTDKEHPEVTSDEIVENKLQDAVSEQADDSEVTPVPSISISTEENEKVKTDNQGNTETLQQLDSENLKENDADSGTGSTADNSSIDLNLSISSFLSKNKETGSISLQVSVSIYSFNIKSHVSVTLKLSPSVTFAAKNSTE